MPRAKLTDVVVANASLPVGRSDLIIWDTDVTGFCLRVRKTSLTWMVAYRPRGGGRSANVRHVKIGTPSSIKTAKEARAVARSILGSVAAGADPAAERAEQKRRVSSTVGELLDRYDRDLERRKYVHRKVVIAGLRARMAKLLDRDIATIKGAELAAIADRLDIAGRGGAAGEFRVKGRTFFGWCLTKAKVIETNPLAGYRKERATKADRIAKSEHGRALSDAELLTLWQAGGTEKLFGRLVRYLILTGCRRGEGVGLKWSMIDADAGLIRLPASLTKQGRPHNVPITPLLADLLKSCPKMADVDLVFPSWKTGREISGWRPMREMLEKDAGLSFTLHDLRRTFRTGLSRLGVEEPVAELAIGHARADLIRRYDRDDAAEPVRDAFTRWDRHVTGLIAKKPSAPAPALIEADGVFA